MIRRFGVVMLCGLLLAACGTVSADTQVRHWISATGFRSSFHTLRGDTATVSRELRDLRSTAADLHTVCGVLLVDVHFANDLLPSPDKQATNELGAAYLQLSSAATECYNAGNDLVRRAHALRTLQDAYGNLYFGALRVWTAANRTGTP